MNARFRFHETLRRIRVGDLLGPSPAELMAQQGNAVLLHCLMENASPVRFCCRAHAPPFR